MVLVEANFSFQIISQTLCINISAIETGYQDLSKLKNNTTCRKNLFDVLYIIGIKRNKSNTREIMEIFRTTI
jgi:hypothetical protein